MRWPSWPRRRPIPRSMTVRIAEVGATEHSTWGVFAAEGPGVRVDADAQTATGGC